MVQTIRVSLTNDFSSDCLIRYSIHKICFLNKYYVHCYPTLSCHGSHNSVTSQCDITGRDTSLGGWAILDQLYVINSKLNLFVGTWGRVYVPEKQGWRGSQQW